MLGDRCCVNQIVECKCAIDYEHGNGRKCGGVEQMDSHGSLFVW